MKFLKLFSKKETRRSQRRTFAASAITYSIDESGEMFIDVTISEFDEENIKHLANLFLVTIASPKCHLTTMEMLKNNFDEAKEKEYFDKLVNIVVSQQLLSASKELLSRKNRRNLV